MEKTIVASQQAINYPDPETATLSRQLAESLGLLDEGGYRPEDLLQFVDGRVKAGRSEIYWNR